MGTGGPKRTPCGRCVERGPSGYLREPYFYDPAFDATWGLEDMGGEIFACGTCGTRYRRKHSEASMFHDYDDYQFARLDDDE